MGLAVAYQLTLDGHQPIIYEADDRVGGMAATFDFSGTQIERYYHFHCTSDLDFFKVLEELNLTDKLKWTRTKMGYWYMGKVQPWGNPFALLKFDGLGLMAKVRYGLHAFISVKRNNWKPLDQIEASGWIKRWVGTESWEKLWRRLFDYKFYDYSENLSAAWIWTRIRRIGRSRYNLFHEKLGYLEGGSDTLLNALKKAIEDKGGEFRLKSPVSKVRISNGKIEGIESQGVFESFDKVVSTIPLPYVPSVFSELPTDILNKYKSVKNIAVVCIIVKLKKPLTENFWLNTNDPSMDIPGLVEYTNLRKMGEHIVYVPYYVPGEHPKYQEEDIVFTTKVKNYLFKINPSLKEDDIIDIRASRYRYAQPICPPGYLEQLPSVELPVSGLWIADTSYYYPEDRGISESIGFGRNMAKMATR